MDTFLIIFFTFILTIISGGLGYFIGIRENKIKIEHKEKKEGLSEEQIRKKEKLDRHFQGLMNYDVSNIYSNNKMR